MVDDNTGLQPTNSDPKSFKSSLSEIFIGTNLLCKKLRGAWEQLQSVLKKCLP